MRKILPAAALVCASLALAAACAPGGSADAQKPSGQKQSGQKPSGQKPPTPAEQSNAPQRPTVAEIKEDGLTALLKAGAPRERPLLVNFWATWCAPCREEFPDLVKLRGLYAPESLDFALVSLDDPSDIGTAVPDFLLESGAASLPAYLLHSEDDNAAINSVDPTWGGELPATFLYDRAGRLAYTHKGRIKPADLQAAIDKTLDAK
jgi:thiol-disulfide isomerase/thioredoxin